MKVSENYKRTSSRLLARLGWSYVATILLIATLIAYIVLQILSLQQSLSDIVSNRNYKIELSGNLLTAAYNRHNSIVRQLLTDDAFDRDEYRLQYDKWGYEVGKIRNELKRQTLDKFENDNIQKQDAIIADIVDLQERIVSAAAEDDLELARQLLNDQLLTLDAAFDDLTEDMRHYQRKRINEATRQASALVKSTITYSIIITAAVVLIIAVIALIVRRSSKRQSQLIASQVTDLDNANSTIKELLQIERETSSKVKDMFGRYVSNDVLDNLLENSDNLQLGGERKNVTIMMADLRGFTAISERISPEQVVTLLNNYFDTALEIIFHYQGTVIEILGDSLLVIFGAPNQLENRVDKSVACAIEMQNSMSDINKRNAELGLPPLEVGIALNDSEVIVGNIGSDRHSKYAVVGSAVNNTGRIESYTVGGQIFASSSIVAAAERKLRIDARHYFTPKGSHEALSIFEIGGIGGDYGVALEHKDSEMINLTRTIPINFALITDKVVDAHWHNSDISRLSLTNFEIISNRKMHKLDNIKLKLSDVDKELGNSDFYGKVIDVTHQDENRYLVCLTSLPPVISAYFKAFIQHAK